MVSNVECEQPCKGPRVYNGILAQIDAMRIEKKKPKGKQPDSVINAIVTQQC